MPFKSSTRSIYGVQGATVESRGLKSDPFASNLQLALPLGGSYGLADYSATIKKSGSNKTMTVVRGAGTNLDQAKWYESSLFMGTFNARNTITTPTDSSIGLTNQDFTIEGWYYFTQNNIGYQALASHSGNSGDAQSGWIIALETNNTLVFYSSAGSGWQLTVGSSYIPPINQWIHIAVTRQSNTTRMFANGTLLGSSTTVSNILTPSTREFRLGNYLWFPGGERGMSGYIQDFRLYVGVAKYTSNFSTPGSIANGSTNLTGLTQSTAVSSISQLRSNGITGDGVYWFSTTQNPTPFKTFCKFNYIDGQDWALILKLHNRGDMPSGSTFWTNTSLNNDSDFNLYGSTTFSKYQGWSGIPFNRLMVNMADRVPPIMIFNTQRTLAGAISLAGTPTNGSGIPADSTDPAFGAGAGHDYSNSSAFPMKLGANFTRQANGQEWFIQRYGISSWGGNANNSTTSVDGLASTGRCGAWIGAPMDEGTHTFNVVSNPGSDSGWGIGATAGNTARTTSAGYIEWNSGIISDTLPAFVWVR